MTSNLYVRKILALIIGVLCATLAAVLITPLISKDNESFFAWDYYTLNKIGLWFFTFGFISIFIVGYRKTYMCALLELSCIVGISFMYVKYCTVMERYSFFRSFLDLCKGVLIVYVFGKMQEMLPVFSFLRRIEIYAIFYRTQFWGYLVLNRWFRVPKHISLLITDVILLLIVLLIFIFERIQPDEAENESLDKVDDTTLEKG